MREDPDSEWKTLKKLRTETETVPALLSVSEVAKLFPIGKNGHITEKTVRQWITDGLLEGKKMGKYIWIKAEDVNCFIEEERRPKQGGHDMVIKGRKELEKGE